jgi:predicted NAD-dependent protein-ADP-ribosyltransferase YbiA (DUF1768 family)
MNVERKKCSAGKACNPATGRCKKIAVQKSKCEGKECPAGTACNPDTGRCKKVAVKKAKCEGKECPPGKACNPTTGRCKNLKATSRKVTCDPSKMTDKLYFYSKSRDLPPGKGVNEIVQNAEEYTELGKIKDWRKVLSNFHVAPFEYDGYTWNTIEHVFQSKKIEIVDPQKALWFTIESGHEIGQGDGEVARKNRKLVKLSHNDLAKWATMRDKVMHDAAVDKYKACKEAATVLKATKCAQLWHIVSRSKPVRFVHLEQIRDTMSA